jgi:hypothetical protein
MQITARTFPFSANATLTLKLEAQLGAGYGWEIAEMDRELLARVGQRAVEGIPT